MSWVYGVTGELRMHKLSTQIPSSPSGTPHMDFHHQHFGKYPRGGDVQFYQAEGGILLFS